MEEECKKGGRVGGGRVKEKWITKWWKGIGKMDE